MKTLETERLILRSFNENDIDDFHEYCRNPNVGPNAGWEPHKDKEASLNILKNFIEKDNVWAIEYKINNKLIGSIGLHTDELRNIPNVRMVGYVLSEDYWGMGLMTEAVKRVIKYAFEELCLDLLSVFHYPFNIRSKHVIEKCGFKYEGTLLYSRQIYDGTIYDSACYSMTKREFEEFYGIHN
ncbi:MAG: hypothetical protein K0S55_1736 [Clostridia bacterium]|nr:hypothetical protein [Clostridia bacterium]